MRKIVKYEFSNEDLKVLTEVGDAIDEICDRADEDCYLDEKHCPFFDYCAYSHDDICRTFGDAVKAIQEAFDRVIIE